MHFLRVSAGNAGVAKLLLTCKLKVSGDLALAKKQTSFFDIPNL